jgi:adenosyl cobinamide kinase/adenosyl cobinamide phosphate guanylyltransferase
MSRRIAAHRQRRPADWRTVEEPWDVPAAVAGDPTPGCVLVECVSLWLTNLLVGVPGHEPLPDTAARQRVEELAAAGRAAPGRVILVSHEVGCGIMPVNALARRFGDLLGEANQGLASAAEEVYACLAGIPLRIK